MKITISVVLLAIVVVIFAVCFFKPEGMDFDNTTPPGEVITRTYEIAEMQELQQQINLSGIPREVLNRKVLAECVRNTDFGSYIVLRQADGKHVFIFLDEDGNATYCIISSCSKTFLDFDFVKPGVTTLTNMVAFDPETVLSPVSAVSQTGHILADGILLINYSGLDGDRILEDPVVSSLQFITNDDIEQHIRETGGCLIPYILPIDKVAN